MQHISSAMGICSGISTGFIKTCDKVGHAGAYGEEVLEVGSGEDKVADG